MNKKSTKERIIDILKTIAIVFMLLAVIFIIPEIVFALKMLFQKRFLAALILFLLAVGTFAAVLLIFRIQDKKDEKKKRDYGQKYLTEIKVRDLEIGELVFRHDSSKRSLCLVSGVPALCGGDELEVYADDSGMDTAPLVECIKRVLKDKQKIVEGMYGVVRSVYEQEDITEEEAGGDPLDRDYIMSRLSIYSIDISLNHGEEWTACIYGGMNNDVVDHIDEHGITGEFSRNSPDYEFYSG